MDFMFRKHALPARFRPILLVACVLSAAACEAENRQKATYTSVYQAFTVYTLTGAPSASPNALSFLGGGVRASSAFGFDVAFEIDAQGRAVIYPVRALGGALAGTLKRVGLQTVPVGFSALLEVPAAGYDTLNALTVSPGTTIAVELRDTGACYAVSILSPVAAQFIYAKMVVDSVSIATRRVYGRTVFDPNCGYRGVIPDSIPRN